MAENEGGNSCKTIIVLDAPSPKDLFGGAHRKIVQAIIEIIETGLGGITIGLQGTWGSGKSTVVKLLTDYFHKKNRGVKSTVVFLFDTWAHEGDPLRRTYLEKMLKFLVKERWISPEYGQEKLDSLSGRLEIKKSETRPVVTKTGKWLIFTGLLTPVGLSLLSKGLDIGVYAPFTPGLPVNWYFVVGLILAGAPFLAVSVFQIRRWEKIKSGGYSAKELDALDPFLVISQKAIINEVTETMRTPDPTSVEFESIFFEVLNRALRLKKRKLILVIDNLDRVTREEGISMLSTLQTFISHTSSSKSSQFDRLWVLIPYDRNSISKLWEGKKSRLGSQLLDELPEPKEDKADKHDKEHTFLGLYENVSPDDVTSAMIDKRFQIVFYVPEVTLSNWRTFFIGLLEKAFPEHRMNKPGEFEDTYDIVRIYYENWKNRPTIPTPRELVNIVNQIGSLHRQWVDEFPLPEMAYFTLLLKANPKLDMVDNLRKRVFPQVEFARFLTGPLLIDHLAAMWFNVKVAEALQILIRPDLESALRAGNQDKLLSLLDASKGNLAVLETIDFQSLFDLNELASAIVSLDAVGYFENKYNIEKRRVARILGLLQASLFQESYPFGLNRTVGKAFSILSVELKESKILLKVISEISPRLEDGYFYSQDEVPEWSKGLYEILKTLSEVFNVSIEDQIEVPSTSMGYLISLQTMADLPLGRGFIPSLKPQSGADSVIDHIVSETKNDIFEKSGEIWIEGLFAVNEKAPKMFNLAKIGESIVGIINSDEALPPQKTINLYSILQMLINNGIEPNESAQNIVKSGAALSHFAHLKDKPQAKEAAFILNWYSSQAPDLPPPPTFGDAEAGFAILNQMLENPGENYPWISTQFAILLFDLNRIDLLYLVFKEAPRAQGWVIYCLMLLLSDKAKELSLDVSFFVDHWEPLATKLEQDQKSLLVNYRGFDLKLFKALQDLPFSGSKSMIYYDLALHSSNTDEIGFLQWLKVQLKQVSRESWLNLLQMPPKSFLDVLNLVKTRGVKPMLGEQFRLAYLDLAVLILAGKDPGLNATGDYKGLSSLLDKQSLKIFETQLLEAMQKSSLRESGRLSQMFFDIYREDVSDVDILLKSENLVPNIFAEIVTSLDPNGVEWIRSFLKQYPDFLARYARKRKSKGTRRQDVYLFLERVLLALKAPEIDQEITSKISEILAIPEVDSLVTRWNKQKEKAEKTKSV